MSWGVSGVPVPLNSSPQTHGNPGHFSGIPVYPAGHLGPRNDQNGEHQTVLHYNVKCTQYSQNAQLPFSSFSESASALARPLGSCSSVSAIHSSWLNALLALQSSCIVTVSMQGPPAFSPSDLRARPALWEG